MESLIFPLLSKGPNGEMMTLRSPDAEQVDDLKEVAQQLRWLLDKAEQGPLEILKRISEKYLEYYQTSYAQMIKDLKMKQFEREIAYDGTAQKARKFIDG